MLSPTGGFEDARDSGSSQHDLAGRISGEQTILTVLVLLSRLVYLTLGNRIQSPVMQGRDKADRYFETHAPEHYRASFSSITVSLGSFAQLSATTNLP